MSDAVPLVHAVGNRCAGVRANDEILVVDTVSAGKHDPRTPTVVLPPTASEEVLGEAVSAALRRSRGDRIGPDEAPDLYRGLEGLEANYRVWVEHLMQVGGYKTRKQLFRRMKSCSISHRSELAVIEFSPMVHDRLEGWSFLDRDMYVVVPEDASARLLGHALREALQRCTA